MNQTMSKAVIRALDDCYVTRAPSDSDYCIVSIYVARSWRHGYA